MPYTVVHGPPTYFDSTHAWAPATGAVPPVLGDTNKEPRVLPQIVIEQIAGWFDLPDLTDNRAPRTFGVGELPYPSRSTGKTLVYECRVEAADQLDLTLTANAVKQGFSDQDSEGTMTVTPWASYGGSVWTYTARVVALQFDPKFTVRDDGATFEWGLVLTLRMSDPHFYLDGTGYL